MTAYPRKVLLDTEEIEKRHRYDAWRDYYSNLTEVRKRGDDGGEIRAKLQASRVGELVIGRNSYSACITSGRPSSFEDRLILRVLTAGKTRALIGDTPVVMTPGGVYLRHRTQSFFGIHDDIEAWSISAPFDAMRYDHSRPPAQLAFDFRTPLGRVLRANIEAITENLATVTVSEGKALSVGFCAMVSAIINQRANDEAERHYFQVGRELAIRRYIKENLADPTLNSERICRDMAVSRATLFRLFKSEGGIQRFIINSRLERSLLQLVKSPPQRGVIGAVAAGWSFDDAPQYSRQFKAYFGFSPSDVVGIGNLSRREASSRLRPSRAPMEKGSVPLTTLMV